MFFVKKKFLNGQKDVKKKELKCKFIQIQKMSTLLDLHRHGFTFLEKEMKFHDLPAET